MRNPLPKLEEMTDILDLKDLIPWDLRWLWALLISLGAIAVVLLFLSWWRRRGRRPPPPEQAKTPLEAAILKLEELVNSRLIESGQVRRFYFGVSDLFREFIEKELGIAACEETLEELKIQLKKSSEIQPQEYQEAMWLLDLADMAKFAKFVPVKDEIIKSVKVCRVWMVQVAERRAREFQETLKMEEVQA